MLENCRRYLQDICKRAEIDTLGVQDLRMKNGTGVHILFKICPFVLLIFNYVSEIH